MNDLEMKKIFAEKLTENGDVSYSTTLNKYLDILFMADYYKDHLYALDIGNSAFDKLFAMFIRDPRYGMGRRDVGRKLLRLANCSYEEIVKCGRYDDLLYINCFDTEALRNWRDEVLSGNELAKKWCPRFNTSKHDLAHKLCRAWGFTPAQYRKLIKCSTVENKLTHKDYDAINFEHVPSLAMIKYFKTFSKRINDRFEEYRASVEKGDAKLHVSTTNVYDIYKHRNSIDAQLIFDRLEKIEGNWLPILDTSGSMQDLNDSIGKATSIAHYLSKCSTYAPNMVMTFSSSPFMIDMGKPRDHEYNCSFEPDYNSSKYTNEMNSLYTGDCSNTDFGAVMRLLKTKEIELPEYLVVLSDMEFDCGSTRSKDETMKMFKRNGIKTKIIWWNLNSRATTVPETDEYGNIYMSGYSPMLLKYLHAGFDGNKFLENLLKNYLKNLCE